MKVIWAISADGIVVVCPLCTGSCSNTYAERVSCIRSRLDRNLLIRISLLEIVGCVMLTIIWSLPLFGWFFTCQRSFLPKLKNKPQMMRSILSSSDFVLQQCTVKKKFVPCVSIRKYWLWTVINLCMFLRSKENNPVRLSPRRNAAGSVKLSER